MEWEPVGRDRIRGWAGGVTSCRLQRKATEFSATIEAPREGAWRAGGVLHFEGPDDYAIFLVDAGGTLRVNRRRGGAWEVLEQAEGVPVADGKVRFTLLLTRAGVQLAFDGGAAHGPWDLPKPAFGLALESCDVVFSGLEWK
jgi:hypothetical protein